ncbi:MAG: ABC transporter ATP-binding protein [Candidatus Bathyarchaeota archaeon]|nr:ABC transporter ATP-binding protein [Candidatus Bathyarchaeota archaeon]
MLEGFDVTKRFGGLVALKNVDFHVDEGEIAGLIGPNGAGKTTLFNIISGTFPPTSGLIKFGGEKITGFGAHKICKLGIARTFQIPKPFPNMTVYENVLAAATFGCTKDKKFSDTNQELNKILEKFGLSEKSATPASSLTVFQQRMLELARALSTKPKLLLLDEVMAGLNPTETAQMLKVIRELRNEGITIFMIEHNMRAIMEIAERVMVLHQGMKIAEGKPEEIGRSPEVIEAYLGEAYA